MIDFSDIPGCEGSYQISKNGEVRSLQRYTNAWNKRLIPQKMLTPSSDKDGYLTVVLRKNNVPKTCKVHRLVALTFLPNPRALPQINHIDGNKKNNSISNLEWANNSINQKHKHTLYPNLHRGGRNANAKVSATEVVAIRQEAKLRSVGRKSNVQDVARKYNVTASCIYQILCNKNWNNN